MPKLAFVRKQCDWTFYDTLLKADGPCKPPERRTRLYGNANVGWTNLSNMCAAGMLASDSQFTVMATQTLVSFENETLYGVVARDAKVTLEVGSLDQGGTRPLSLSMVRADKPDAPVCKTREEFLSLCKMMADTLKEKGLSPSDLQWRMMPGALRVPVHIPPRQHFGVVIELFDGAEQKIGTSSGAKSIVHCLHGIITQDLL